MEMVEEKTGGAKQAKVKRQRGPSFPRLGLAETIEKVRKVQASHGLSDVMRETALASMGYSSSKGGAAAATMSCALAYGLLEKRSVGYVGVSKVGMQVCVADGEQRAKALLQAALHPPLHTEIAKSFPGKAIPDQRAVESQLKMTGFPNDSAEAAAKGYVEAIALAGIELVDQEPSQWVDDTPTVARDESNGGTRMQSATTISAPLYDGNSFSLTTARPLTVEDIELVEENLKLQKRVAPHRHSSGIQSERSPALVEAEE